MQRREFMMLTAAVSFALPFAAQAAAPIEYTPEGLAAALDGGKTVFLDFHATWCSTCAAQVRVIDTLKAENPAYEAAISFFNVDWDIWGEGELSKALNIPRRSTLVVLKGKEELGRLVAVTDKDAIKALMDLALRAATA